MQTELSSSIREEMDAGRRTVSRCHPRLTTFRFDDAAMAALKVAAGMQPAGAALINAAYLLQSRCIASPAIGSAHSE